MTKEVSRSEAVEDMSGLALASITPVWAGLVRCLKSSSAATRISSRAEAEAAIPILPSSDRRRPGPFQLLHRRARPRDEVAYKMHAFTRPSERGTYHTHQGLLEAAPFSNWWVVYDLIFGSHSCHFMLCSHLVLPCAAEISQPAVCDWGGAGA